jgi:hypothetical protein
VTIAFLHAGCLMAFLTSTSDSMVGSLCREVDGIRLRCDQLLMAMRSCQDMVLFHRMDSELHQLQKRRSNLALEFLIELASRSFAA